MLMITGISNLGDIYSKFLHGMDVSWCVFQAIPRIWYETDTKHHVILYGSHYNSHFGDCENVDYALFKSIMCTNLGIQYTSCLHLVHILQYPTSRTSTKSTRNTIVKVWKQKLSPLLMSKYNKLTQCSTRRCDQPNVGQCSLEGDTVTVLGALPSVWSKNKLTAEIQGVTHCLSNPEKEKLIEDYMNRETTVARKQVEDAKFAIKQEQEDMRNAEKIRLTTIKPEIPFEEMLNAMGVCLSNLASSNDGEDEDEDDYHQEDAELGMLSKDDKPSRIMNTISNMVQHRIRRF